MNYVPLPITDKLKYHSNIYHAADSYLIPTLKQAAAQKFDAAIRAEEAWDSEDFLRAVEYIYESEAFDSARSRELRDLAVEVIVEHGDYHTFFDSSRDSGNISLPILMSKYAELGRDIVVKSLPTAMEAAPWEGFRQIKCGVEDCSYTWGESRPEYRRTTGAMHCMLCRRRSAYPIQIAQQ